MKIDLGQQASVLPMAQTILVRKKGTLVPKQLAISHKVGAPFQNIGIS